MLYNIQVVLYLTKLLKYMSFSVPDLFNSARTANNFV